MRVCNLRFLAVSMALIMIMATLTPQYLAEPTTQLTLSAKSAILMDANTGRVLYSQESMNVMPMASLTKIMTTALALEYGNLEELATTSLKASELEASKIYLLPGEKMTISDLIYATMLHSANDAAQVLGEHIGGSQEEFARMMTAKARALGASNTTFKNPHGLDEDGHESTAYDMALISRYAMTVPGFAEVAATQRRDIAGNRTVYNGNQTLNRVVGGDGVKIGFTDNASRCLSASATRNGHRLIAVVLNAPDWYNDAATLLNHGFSLVDFRPAVSKNELIKTVAVNEGQQDRITLAAKHSYYLPLLKGQEEERDIAIYWHVPDYLEAPIQMGEVYGELSIYFKGQPIGSVPLIATRSILRKQPWWARLWPWGRVI